VPVNCGGTVPGVIGNLQAIEIIKIVTGLKRILVWLVLNMSAMLDKTKSYIPRA